MPWNPHKQNYEDYYRPIHNGMLPIEPSVQKKLEAVCQRNFWLKRGGLPFEDDPFMELDYDYSFVEIKTVSVLKMYFEHGNWAIRNGVVYKDLVFINQVNAGDEWWTLKKSGEDYIPFESITFSGHIRRGDFEKFIRQLHCATVEQCKTLTYSEVDV